MSVHKTPWLRRLGVLVGIASLCAGVVVAPPPAAAQQPPTDIASKQAEAARIAAEVEAKGRQVSILAERLNQARLQATELQAQADTAAAAAARTEAEVATAKETLKGYVVQSYMRGGDMSSLSLMLGGDDSAGAFAVRNAYVKQLTAKERSAIDALTQAKEAAEAKRASLLAAQKDAKDAQAAVDAERRAAAAAEAEAKQALAQVKGDLAELVAAEERRRAEAAERQAAAELAERQRREAAARQPQSPPPGGSRPSSPSSPRPPSGGTGTDPGPAPAPNPGAGRAVEEAKRQIGKPYEWGAEGPDSFDCSGLTMWAWRAGGVSLPHSSKAQYSATRRVSIAEIAPGDLLFYGSPIHHVGIYVGNGTMVEASETGKPVRYASIHRRDLAGVGRPG